MVCCLTLPRQTNASYVAAILCRTYQPPCCFRSLHITRLFKLSLFDSDVDSFIRFLCLKIVHNFITSLFTVGILPFRTIHHTDSPCIAYAAIIQSVRWRDMCHVHVCYLYRCLIHLYRVACLCTAYFNFTMLYLTAFPSCTGHV